jgi:hypothetical protein
LALAPGLARLRNVVSLLFGGVQHFLRNTSLGGIDLEWLENEPQ